MPRHYKSKTPTKHYIRINTLIQALIRALPYSYLKKHKYLRLPPQQTGILLPRFQTFISIYFTQNPLAPLPTPIKPGDCSRPIEPEESPPKGIPILITWNLGGNSVSIEGSWDNWSSRKAMHKSGKDHSILLVLPSGIYHYKFIVDGELRCIPDLPSAKDEADEISNILDVHDFVPESLDSVAGFEAPASPDAAYGWHFPNEDEFSKDAPILPSQLLESVLKTSDEPSVVKPQHVVLNHLFLEKGLSQRSLLALSLTHRFKSKYVSMVLYKPINR